MYRYRLSPRATKYAPQPHCHPALLLLHYSTQYSKRSVHATHRHTRARGVVRTLVPSQCSPSSQYPKRGCRSCSYHRLSRSHLYSLALFTSNSCVPSRHRWFSLSSQPIALGESGADVRGGPRLSSGESVSSASSSSKVSMGVSRERRLGTVKRGDRPKGLAEGDAPRAARESLLSKASLPR